MFFSLGLLSEWSQQRSAMWWFKISMGNSWKPLQAWQVSVDHLENSFVLSKQCLPIEVASSFSVGQGACIRCSTVWLHTLKPPTETHQGCCTERSDYLNLNTVSPHCLTAFPINSDGWYALRKCNVNHLVPCRREHSCHLSHNNTTWCGYVHIMTRSGCGQLSWMRLGIVWTRPVFI